MPSRPGPLLLSATLVAALLALPSCAPETGSEAAVAEADAPSASLPEEAIPHEMTCAEIKEAFGDEENEEEASYLLVWAYGIRTGAHGLDFGEYPVTKAGLEDFVARVFLTCKADPDKLFVDAILE